MTDNSIVQMASPVWSTATDVAFFWQTRLLAWWFRKNPLELWLQRLIEARSYEEYEEAAFHLDDILGNELWRQNPTSKYYDYRLIYDRLQAITEAWEDQDILTLLNLLRSGLVRNLGNITAPPLYNRAYAGTKLLIEDYITQVALAIEHVTILPTSPAAHRSGLTSQAKLDLLHDTRQAFGRSTLVLQGGAIFGLCHLGVVKALHLRGLLPRIITGTATGALIAALVAVHTEDELLDFLTGDGIDLTAFQQHKGTSSNGVVSSSSDNFWQRRTPSWLNTIQRRVTRFFREGYFLDVNILEECVRANVGDLTFEEAYARTKRVLNITVSTNTRGGVPNLLNHITAPNVLIWSAALASNTSTTPSSSSSSSSSSSFYRTSTTTTTTPGLFPPVILKCKDEKGHIIPWGPAETTTFQAWTSSTYKPTDRESPLSRVAELFNVNHFIISQARPYLAPFLKSDMSVPDPRPISTSSSASGGFSLNPFSIGKRWWAFTTNINTPLTKLVTMEIHHRLNQLDSLNLLPPQIRRFLIDENIPGASLTLVPELNLSDLVRLLETPTKESVEGWILRGERSVWPAIGALKVRCALEVELDRGYQIVRRRKPMDLIPSVGTGMGGMGGGMGGGMAGGAMGGGGSGGSGEGRKSEKKRIRAASMSEPVA
ncbi:MAG: hypothetical protein M1823_004392 [Watsoniomyces obsoletus]|nr:MAG: hypothetical protein M1823_004392 [Watsoniomyces obsoletus]